MPKITNIRPADAHHQVVEVRGGNGGYRRKPCADCPWRKDAVGVFPAEAFRHSANTAYDMASQKFGCHQSGVQKSATCAGFLLRGSDDNMSVRIARMTGAIKDDVHANGVELFDSYTAMAIANGVDEDDPVLAPIPRR